MLNIIVVDDSLILRRNLSKMLFDMGYRVSIEAKDGLEAISAYERFMPDLVTMDITMPEMNGIEAVQEIRKKHKDAKIIMVTSHGQEDMVMGAIRAGASGYVLKPVTPDKLLKAIDKIFPELAAQRKSASKVDGDVVRINEDGDLFGDDDDDDLKIND